MNEVLLERIYRSIEWLEENDEFCVRKMAETSCLSLYHFSRVFYSMTGMTPALYQRRRALTKAVKKLQKTDDRVLNIALDSGYETQESFTRAFKKMFNQTPAGVRKSSIDLSPIKQERLKKKDLIHIGKGGINLTPIIRYHEMVRVYGVTKEIEFDDYALANKVWIEYLNEHSADGVLYGVCTGTVRCERISLSLSYLCGSAEVCSRAEHVEIIAGRYACFTHNGRLQDIGTTLKYIWQCWLAKTEHQLRDASDFEVYDHRFNQETLEGEIEIWIPIEG